MGNANFEEAVKEFKVLNFALGTAEQTIRASVEKPKVASNDIQKTEVKK